MRRISILIVFLMSCSTAYAQEVRDLTREQIDNIERLVEILCTNPPLEGATTRLKLEGEATAEALGIIRRLTESGLSGAAVFEQDSYIGLPRDEVTAHLEEANKCRQAILYNLLEKETHSEGRTTSKVNELMNETATLSALLDVRGVQEKDYTFVLTGDCRLVLSWARESGLGFKWRYNLLTSYDSEIGRSVSGKNGSPDEYFLTAGSYSLKISAKRDAGFAKINLKTFC